MYKTNKIKETKTKNIKNKTRKIKTILNKNKNNMKTITTIFTIILIITSQLLNAQSKSDKMYDVFENKDGISSFSFSKNMIDAINLDLGEDGEEKSVTGDLNKIRFMSYNPEKGDLCISSGGFPAGSVRSQSNI